MAKDVLDVTVLLEVTGMLHGPTIIEPFADSDLADANDLGQMVELMIKRYKTENRLGALLTRQITVGALTMYRLREVSAGVVVDDDLDDSEAIREVLAALADQDQQEGDKEGQSTSNQDHESALVTGV